MHNQIIPHAPYIGGPSLANILRTWWMFDARQYDFHGLKYSSWDRLLYNLKIILIPSYLQDLSSNSPRTTDLSFLSRESDVRDNVSQFTMTAHALWLFAIELCPFICVKTVLPGSSSKQSSPSYFKEKDPIYTLELP